MIEKNKFIMQKTKYKCPCCGYKTLDEEPPGTFDTCPLCSWEDDRVQYYDNDYKGGANRVSLNEAKENFKKYEVSELEFKKYVKPPLEDEI